MKRTGIIIFGIVLAIIFALTIGYLVKKAKPAEMIIETKSPENKNIVKKTLAVGSVIPKNQILIKPNINGIINELYVEPGDYVKKGDLIAKVTVIPNMIELNNAESRVKKAKIDFANAETDFKRYKGLFEKNVISETEFLNYELNFQRSKEDLTFAEDNLQLIREGVKKQASKSSNTLVRSTIEGTILDVPIEEGNSVIMTNTFNEGTTIAEIADMNEMIFEGMVGETEVGKLREGMSLILTIGAIEDTKFDAKLDYISPKGSDENGTVQFEIKASITLNDSSYIRAGYSANADIVLEKKDSVMAIPESLLHFKGDSTFVKVQTQPDIFEDRFIKTGLSDGVFIEVLDGITMDDKIKSGEKPAGKGHK